MIIFLLITITFLFLSNVTNGILVALYLKKKHTKEKELLLEKKKAWKEEQDKMHHTIFHPVFIIQSKLGVLDQQFRSICLFSRPRIRDSSFEGKTIGMEN